MPTEYRFDDLELREEPAPAYSASERIDTLPQYTCDTCGTEHCTGSAQCTVYCCSDIC